MIAGPTGRFEAHLRHVQEVLGLRRGMRNCSTMHLLILEQRQPLFIADTYVANDPSAEELAETTLSAAGEMRRFGLEPRVAFLSHSNFGSRDSETARKMRRAVGLVHQWDPDLEVDGEMHGDAALVSSIRQGILPDSALKSDANLLIMPNLDAANIAFNLLKAVTSSVAVGPILMGPARPAHVVTASVTARGIVNLAAVAAVEAQAQGD